MLSFGCTKVRLDAQLLDRSTAMAPEQKEEMKDIHSGGLPPPHLRVVRRHSPLQIPALAIKLRARDLLSLDEFLDELEGALRGVGAAGGC